MPVARAQDVVKRAAEERATFVEFIRGVPEVQWSNTAADGRWQARDYVAHLASIDPLITAWFRRVQTGGDTSSGHGDFSIDDWNEEMILARRSTSIDDLIDEMARNRDELDAALSDFTDEQLDSTIHFAGDSKRAARDVPLHLYLQGWLFHDRWHTEDARRALSGEPEQPFGDEAFAKAMTRRRANGSA
jgi:DinB superfamily